MTGESRDTIAESSIIDFITKEIVTRPELLPIGLDTQLIESGILDSLSILRLVSFIEDKFSVKVSPEDVVGENFETVKSIIGFVIAKKK